MEKNVYFNILKIFINDNKYKIYIKNIYNEKLSITIEDTDYILDTKIIKEISLISLKFSIKINNKELDKTNFNYNFENKNISGFDKNTLVETINGPTLIKDISSDDIILDKNGNNLRVINVFIFTINNNNNNTPIIIDKSNCGLNLPYQPLIMSIKNNLKIKKIVLKGRNLYLNRKASIYNFEKSFDYYALETESQKDYLVSGFVTNSI